MYITFQKHIFKSQNNMQCNREIEMKGNEQKSEEYIN